MANTITIKSRIHENFSATLLSQLERICKMPMGSNNEKIDIILELLDDNIVYEEIGTGTNRLAIKIENYIYKIALDPRGIIDNDNEFVLTHELQPYVIKTYETNGIISVCEYVRCVESKAEFDTLTSDIVKILTKLSNNAYLLGDVGINANNFCNWGFRKNGKLVILDFAYIYKIKKAEIFCVKCGKHLRYDSNFIKLYCVGCSCKYSFVDVRSQISMDEERADQELAKQYAFKLTTASQDFIYKTQDNEEELSMKVTDIGYPGKPEDAFDVNTQNVNPAPEVDMHELYLQTLDELNSIEYVYYEEVNVDSDVTGLMSPNDECITYDEDEGVDLKDIDDVINYMNTAKEDEDNDPEGLFAEPQNDYENIDDTNESIEIPKHVEDSIEIPEMECETIDDSVNVIYEVEIPLVNTDVDMLYETLQDVTGKDMRTEILEPEIKPNEPTPPLENLNDFVVSEESINEVEDTVENDGAFIIKRNISKPDDIQFKISKGDAN